MPLTISWKEEGRIEGIHEGTVRFVTRQLQRRLGPLSTDFESRIQSIATEQLETLVDELLDFRDLGEVENWIAAHSA